MTDANLVIEHPGKFAMLQRYALAVVAPSTVSAAHLVVQIMLLATLTPAEFGAFAFLMIVVQLGFGLSNALVATPYTVQVSNAGADVVAGRGMYFTANAIFVVVFGGTVYAIGVNIADGHWASLFATFAALAMVRWFGRAHNYAVLRPAVAGLSDLAYAISLILIITTLAWRDLLSLQTVSLGLVAASLLGCGVLGGEFLVRQFRLRDLSNLRSYAEVWRGQSRWTLLGVVTTETTANIHAYLVTLIAGPAAFAPIGAAALFVRPVLLAMSSLSQLEIPVLGRSIAAGRFVQAVRTCRRFLGALLLVWLATAALAYGIVTYAPDVIIKPDYPIETVGVAVALFLAISFFQVWQGPNSALLQALREFKDLSKASVVSSFFSVGGVFAVLLLFPPVYSLIGILAGQSVMAAMLARRIRQWRRAHA